MGTEEAGAYPYSFTLFQEPWWLDLVAPGRWQEAVVEKGGQVIARLPYIYRKEGPLGLKVSDLPPFTNTLGPWIAPGKGKYSKQLSYYSNTVRDLVRQLPKLDFFEQCLHYSQLNWLPFYWERHEEFLSYTLIVEDLSSPEAVWDGLQPRIRNNVRKAEDRLEIREDLDVEQLTGIIRQTYTYRHSREKFDETILRNVIDETRRRKAGLTLYAVDEQDEVRAVSFIVHDDRSAHFILNGVDRRFNDSHANSFIIWEGIKRCCGLTAEFNFHGNIHPDVFSYFLKFGARLHPFVRVQKKSRLMRVCDSMQRLGRFFRLTGR